MSYQQQLGNQMAPQSQKNGRDLELRLQQVANTVRLGRIELVAE